MGRKKKEIKRERKKEDLILDIKNGDGSPSETDFPSQYFLDRKKIKITFTTFVLTIILLKICYVIKTHMFLHICIEEFYSIIFQEQFEVKMHGYKRF